MIGLAVILLGGKLASHLMLRRPLTPESSARLLALELGTDLIVNVILRHMYGLADLYRLIQAGDIPENRERDLVRCMKGRDLQTCLLFNYSWSIVLATGPHQLVYRYPLKECLFSIFYEGIFNIIAEPLFVYWYEGRITLTLFLGNAALSIFTVLLYMVLGLSYINQHRAYVGPPLPEALVHPVRRLSFAVLQVLL
jgi:hypothetical protein